MEAQVAAALEVSNYKQVAKLLKQWQGQDPKNPMLRVYAAQLQERTNRLEAAEKTYLKLLKQAPGNKVMKLARAGIQRIQQRQKDEKAAALTEAKQIADGEEAAILAIATPSEAHKKDAIAGVANIFKLDPYTARMKVPTSGFRLHRVGPWGEISYYAKSLGKSHVPTLYAKVKDIKALQTFQICYFEAIAPQPNIVCQNADGQLGKISFDWSEVSQRVSSQLPIFEQVVDIGNWGRTVHKEKVQDYVQVVDLHLTERNIILRMCDRLYQYQQGISLGETNELNSRIQWNQLITQITSFIKAPHHNDFTRFGKGALEFINLLPYIQPHLDIDRREPSDWDLAFHLYSTLCYLNRSSLAHK